MKRFLYCVILTPVLFLTGCFNFVSIMAETTGIVLFGPKQTDFRTESELRELLKKDRNVVYQAMGRKHMEKMTDDEIVDLAKKLEMIDE